MVLFAFPGIAQFVGNFAEPGDPEYAPPVQKGETPVSLYLSQNPVWRILFIRNFVAFPSFTLP